MNILRRPSAPSVTALAAIRIFGAETYTECGEIPAGQDLAAASIRATAVAGGDL